MSHLLTTFDGKYTNLIRRLPASYKPIMEALSIVGEPYIVCLVGLMGYVLAVHRHSQTIQRAFLYGALAYGVNIIFKFLLHRRRPHGLIVTTLGLHSYSFPSGHAFGTVIFYGLFAYLDLKYIVEPFNTIMAVLIGILIFIVGISRVYLGSHYPSDVVAGWLVGLISLAVIGWLVF